MNTETPRTNEALAAILERDCELSEKNAPEALVKLCRAMECKVEELNHQIARSQAAGTIWYRRCLGEDAEWNLGELTKMTDERDELRDLLQEEQRLHIQTLNERDEARAKYSMHHSEAERMTRELSKAKAMLRIMNRPQATIEANNELEQYEMYSVEPLCAHDGDGARQHIATIYDHEEAREILRLWNSLENEKLERERDEAREYADKLAGGLPDGMLPKDVEVLREANLGLAMELAEAREMLQHMKS